MRLALLRTLNQGGLDAKGEDRGAHDHSVDCPSPPMPLVYAYRSLFEVPRGFSGAVRASASGGAQACGEGGGAACAYCVLLPSPLLPFTTCVRSLDRACARGGAQAGGEEGGACA